MHSSHTYLSPLYLAFMRTRTFLHARLISLRLWDNLLHPQLIPEPMLGERLTQPHENLYLRIVIINMRLLVES